MYHFILVALTDSTAKDWNFSRGLSAMLLTLSEDGVQHL